MFFTKNASKEKSASSICPVWQEIAFKSDCSGRNPLVLIKHADTHLDARSGSNFAAHELFCIPPDWDDKATEMAYTIEQVRVFPPTDVGFARFGILNRRTKRISACVMADSTAGTSRVQNRASYRGPERAGSATCCEQDNDEQRG